MLFARSRQFQMDTVLELERRVHAAARQKGGFCRLKPAFPGKKGLRFGPGTVKLGEIVICSRFIYDCAKAGFD